MRDEEKSKVELIEELRRARRRLEDAGLDPAGSAGDANESAPVDPKLTEKLNQLTNILNSMADMVFVKDLELRTVLSNEAFATAVGKTPAETVGNTDIENGWAPELVHGDPKKGIRGALKATTERRSAASTFTTLAIPPTSETRFATSTPTRFRFETPTETSPAFSESPAT